MSRYLILLKNILKEVIYYFHWYVSKKLNASLEDASENKSIGGQLQW